MVKPALCCCVRTEWWAGSRYMGNQWHAIRYFSMHFEDVNHYSKCVCANLIFHSYPSLLSLSESFQPIIAKRETKPAFNFRSGKSCSHISPHVREYGFRNPENVACENRNVTKFCFWNLESRALESGIPASYPGLFALSEWPEEAWNRAR